MYSISLSLYLYIYIYIYITIISTAYVSTNDIVFFCQLHGLNNLSVSFDSSELLNCRLLNLLLDHPMGSQRTTLRYVSCLGALYM